MKKKNFGFTLIELLVAMTIVAILLGISLVSYQGARKSARDGRRKADLEQIRGALEMYRTDVGDYPDSITGSITYGTKTYLSVTPTDPSTADAYYYAKGTNTYDLCTFLEVGGTAGSCGAASCGSGRTCNYRLTSP
ncbi:type II secretion system protein [Candidatus Shapirobacteria bacterium]|nr:type II secretion system protein [Candidatus Shapirobacteria bacterium]